MDGSSAYPPEFVRDAESNRLDDVVALSAGQNHACAVRGDASLVCWGDPADGRLGAGATAPVGRNHFVTAAVSGVKAVACGSAHSCALLADGAVRCWGAGTNGALGAGDMASKVVPTAPLLPPGSVATAIFSGPVAAGTCATLTTGQVYCWGFNSHGQLGTGDASQYVVTPVEVTAWP
jgi:alpha-tubulin suppressor-like RCC1 family protein